MSRGYKLAIVCLVTGTIGLLTCVGPAGLYLEESIGLSVLFRMRGERKPPSEVVVVALDRESAERLGLPSGTDPWPRSLHARLVRNLAGAGASVIVFDIFFQESQAGQDDAAFADAIDEACNVVLCEAFMKEAVPIVNDPQGQERSLVAERVMTPASILARSAVASAPFPLPKVPVRVSQYWTFKGAEAKPTLPVVAFQVFAFDLYRPFLDLLEHVSPTHAAGLPRSIDAVVKAGELKGLIGALRGILHEEPEIAEKMLKALQRPGTVPIDLDESRTVRLRSLIRMYQSPASQYLNFYGPTGTITTIPYCRVLQSDEETGANAMDVDLKGKAVFVGVSGYRQPARQDGFYTVFSRADGEDICGVEIAATAFANTLEDMHIEHLYSLSHLAAIFLWGVAIGAVCYLTPASISALIVMTAGAVYFIAAVDRFTHDARWLPLVVPFLIQAPFAYFGTILWKYMDANRERKNIRKAFGLYLPDRVVDQLSQGLADMKVCSEITYGTCLCTDGERYVSLSEYAHPKDLTVFLNRYYEIIFEPVSRHGGMVSDVVGDSMMAVWMSKHNDSAPRINACLAALDIDRATNRSIGSSGALRLPTRMGLHSGEISLGNIGGLNHYEYRSVGDAVNTAARIESVNKDLGTRILVSGEVLSGIGCFLVREVGSFILAGKSKPVVLFELICRIEDSDAKRKELCALFAEGLGAYRGQRWGEAIRWFSLSMEISGADGPSGFYLPLCEQYRNNPPQGEWDGLIRLSKK